MISELGKLVEQGKKETVIIKSVHQETFTNTEWERYEDICSIYE